MRVHAADAADRDHAAVFERGEAKKEAREREPTHVGPRVLADLPASQHAVVAAREHRVARRDRRHAEARVRAGKVRPPRPLTARGIEDVDALRDAAFAETARLFGYCRPVLNETRNLVIRNGRHPVLDQNIGEEKFVPNDTDLNAESNRFMLITGPNMAGKSTYIRQVALIALMAQTGSFVPAESAEVGLIDRIFTRVGASDDLAKGQSTFMVEMTETALIANHATEQSLVILDEIGRGTATYDGLSIAWSVVEHLHDKVRCRALFATHYHELTQLAASRPALNNYNVAVREWNEQIIFLRQIIPGAADRSYGIQVARLAGLPDSIISRAKEILAVLEGQGAPPQETSVSEPIASTGAAFEASPKKRSPRQPNRDGCDSDEEPGETQMLLFG